MTTLLSIDPGIRGCGIAEFLDGKLVRAAYVKSPAKAGNTVAAARDMALAIGRWRDVDTNEIAFEWPRIYASRIREGKTKEDPNDLLALCGVDAAIFALAPLDVVATCYAPSDWKAQMSKEATQMRIKARLGVGELTIALDAEAVAKSLSHNMWDAIGIGLHHLGRGFVGVARMRAFHRE